MFLYLFENEILLSGFFAVPETSVQLPRTRFRLAGPRFSRQQPNLPPQHQLLGSLYPGYPGLLIVDIVPVYAITSGTQHGHDR